jgi:predicted N-acetyltransferase YhbS
MHPDFRFATQGDIPALVELINAAFSVEKFFKYGERTDVADLADHLRSGQFLVLELGSQLAGSVYLEVRRQASGQPSGYLGMLAVAPSLQKQGIGTRLMTAGDEYFRQQGCNSVEITVVDLRTELPPLYARYGYAITGTAPFPKDLPVRLPCSFVVMSKQLGSHAS